MSHVITRVKIDLRPRQPRILLYSRNRRGQNVLLGVVEGPPAKGRQLPSFAEKIDKLDQGRQLPLPL